MIDYTFKLHLSFSLFINTSHMPYLFTFTEDFIKPTSLCVCMCVCTCVCICVCICMCVCVHAWWFNIVLLKYKCHQINYDFVNQHFSYGYHQSGNPCAFTIICILTAKPDSIKRFQADWPMKLESQWDYSKQDTFLYSDSAVNIYFTLRNFF